MYTGNWHIQCHSQRQNFTETGARLQIKCVFYFISVMPLSSVNPMFDRLLESSHRDDSNKRSNIGFTEKLTQVVAIEFISGVFFVVKFNRGSSLGLPQCSYGAG